MKFLNEQSIVEKWERALDGINDPYTRKVTAILLDNQAKAIIAEKLHEDITPAATTTGKLGSFQKFAFPIIRRVYPSLIANNICGVQPMQAPTSQIFYLGNSRAGRNAAGTYVEQVVYSKFYLTYRGLVSRAIGSAAAPASGGTGQWSNPPLSGNLGLDGDGLTSFDTSNLINARIGSPSSTVGGSAAMFPNERFLQAYSISAGERLAGTGIPEINFHIEQRSVTARTRKMRTLWTIEAAQDLKAYHDLDLENELTQLLSKELELEIDRELIEDIRMIAYGRLGLDDANNFGGWYGGSLESNQSPVSVPGMGVGQDGGTFVPVAFQYDFSSALAGITADGGSNVFVVDLTASSFYAAPQHVGHVYSNLLAVINFAAQDIFKTTWRGPGTWILTSPLIGSMLESAAKLEGGLPMDMGPTNMQANSIQFKGKFAGKFDLFIDPLYPDDEIMVGYRGSNAMDTGFVYAPYIPMQQLPAVVDPETFQPRRGIISRYGKAAIAPANRFYRIIRLIGPGSNYLFQPFARNTSNFGTANFNYS